MQPESQPLLLSGMKPNFSLPAEQLGALLAQTIASAPALEFDVPLTFDDERWLSRAETQIEAGGSLPDLVEFRVARGNLCTYSHSRPRIMAPLLNAFERVELYSPTSGQARFIPPGETWNGYAALVKVIQPNCTDLLIVDAYLDSSLFIDLLPHSNATKVRCLTQKGSYHAGLWAAFGKWDGDAIGKDHPVELRYAPDRSLHDRMVIIDQKQVWLVSQSLKDIAARSPASLTPADPELAGLKAAHYDQLWSQSAPAQP